MSLEGQDMISNLANRIFTEITAGQYSRTLRVLQHLVLVTDQYVKRQLALIMPCR